MIHLHLLEFNRLIWEYTISRFYQKFPVDYVFIFSIYGFLTFSYQVCYAISSVYIRKVLVKSINSFPPPDLIFENDESESDSEIDSLVSDVDSETESIEKEYNVLRKRQRNSI